MRNLFTKPIRKICDYICDYNRAMSMASSINRKLAKYKGINCDKNVYIIGGGPSVKKFNYKKTSEDIMIGINRVFKDGRFEFDYLFVQDQLPEGFDDFLGYRGDDCIKFMAINPNSASYGIKDFKLRGEYERYVLASRMMKGVPSDITLEPFADLRGTVFSALQFAVYTNPKKIYLVGIDCSSEKNVYNSNDDDYRYQLEGWKIMKKSLADMEMIERVVSINPVGLKNMFKDECTE